MAEASGVGSYNQEGKAGKGEYRMMAAKRRGVIREVILSVLFALLIVGAMVPAGCFSPVLSHQPLFTKQMQLLVTPDDPLVVQTLRTILDAPLPEITEQNYYTNYDGSLHDFNRIKNWLGRFLVDVTDKTAHGVEDYWQLPAETIQLGTGDCEDYAILLCSLLRAYGVPAEDVYVAVGIGVTREDHAWVVEKYYKGVWRIISRYSGDPIVCNSLSDGLKAELFFNDKDGFRRSTIVPSGVFEFELGESFYPLIVSDTLNMAYTNGYSAITYFRELKAGQKVSASLEWLKDSVYSTYNPLIIYPWSFNVYDLEGQIVFSWTGMDLQKDLEFAVPARGVYEIEVVKRDGAPRFGRMTVDPAGWKPRSPTGLHHVPDTALADVPAPARLPPANTYTPAPGVPVLSRDRLVQQVLDLINLGRTGTSVPVLTLGDNPAAQNHAQDMLANQFYSHWGTDGLNSYMRYTRAGGTGYASEYIYVAEVPLWNGAEAAFEQNVLSVLDELLEDFSSTGPPSWSKKVNVGIAYDSRYLFLVLQVETGEVDFGQLPAIQDGTLFFSWQSKFTPVWFQNAVRVYYQRTPSPLSAVQLNNAPSDNPGRLVAEIYESGNYFPRHQIRLWPHDTDPHTVPGCAPVQALGAEPYSDPIAYNILIMNIEVSIQADEVGTLMIEADLSQLVARFGPGVYTVIGPSFYTLVESGTFTGYELSSFGLGPLFVYSIIVE